MRLYLVAIIVLALLSIPAQPLIVTVAATGRSEDTLETLVRGALQDYLSSDSMIVLVDPPREIKIPLDSGELRVIPLPAGFKAVDGGWRLYIVLGWLNDGRAFLMFYRPVSRFTAEKAEYSGWTSLVGVEGTGRGFEYVVARISSIVEDMGWNVKLEWRNITSECVVSTYTRGVGELTVDLRIHVHSKNGKCIVHMLAIYGKSQNATEVEKASEFVREMLRNMTDSLGLTLMFETNNIISHGYIPLKGYEIGDEEWNYEVSKILTSLTKLNVVKGFTAEDIAEVSSLARPGVIVFYDVKGDLWRDAPIAPKYITVASTLKGVVTEHITTCATATPAPTTTPDTYAASTTLPAKASTKEAAHSPTLSVPTVTTPTSTRALTTTIRLTTPVERLEFGVVVTALVGVIAGLLAYIVIARRVAAPY